MRFTNNDKSSMGRILSNRKEYYVRRRTIERPKKEESEDTKIRKDIHRIIMEMISSNKSNIEAEIYIRRLYPNYAEYIAKVVNDQYRKRNINLKTGNTEVSDDGDER